MDLSEDVLDGLNLAGDSVRIPEKLFIHVLKSVAESLVDSTSSDIQANKDLCSLDQATLKQVFAAVAALLLEAAKFDKDAAAVSQTLEDCKFGPERIKQFVTVFQQYKPQFRSILSKIGSNPPHIVDVDWRLDYYIKNNHMEKVSRPVFLINLKTQVNSTADMQMVPIVCTQDQLQDLVGKLRDACKSLERVGQM